MSQKLIILWTCDTIGWAYHNRIRRKTTAMPDYIHNILFFGERIPKTQQTEILDKADIIVCQGVKALRILDLKTIKSVANVVVRFDAMRIDVNGEYYNIWDKKNP